MQITHLECNNCGKHVCGSRGEIKTTCTTCHEGKLKESYGWKDRWLDNNKEEVKNEQ